MSPDLEAMFSPLLEESLALLGCAGAVLAVLDTDNRGRAALLTLCTCGGQLDPQQTELHRLFERFEPSTPPTTGAPSENWAEHCPVWRTIHAEYTLVHLATQRSICAVLLIPRSVIGEANHRGGDISLLQRRAALIVERHMMKSAAELAGQHCEFVGFSEPFLQLEAATKRVAAIDAPVLIMGERGSGKEAVAWALHYYSRRANGPFRSLNCAALSNELYASEFFGWRKGAFTGANSDRAGRFEAANHGTLFLDEVTQCPPNVLASLLRTIEYGEIQKIGDDTARRTDVRIVAATNRDVFLLAREGRFPKDLLDRLNVLSVLGGHPKPASCGHAKPASDEGVTDQR